MNTKNFREKFLTSCNDDPKDGCQGSQATNNSRRDFIRHSTVAAAGLMMASCQGTSVDGARRAQDTTDRPQGFGMLPQTRWPGRLVVGGKTLDDFVAIGEETHPDPTWTVRVFASVSEPTLKIRAQWRGIGEATEWISTLVNDSPKPSGRVSEVCSLAASWPVSGAVDFYGNKGSEDGANDDFMDIRELDIHTVHLMPVGGRSSEGVLPYFALTDRHDSLAVGIGWSGRWHATIRHSEGILQVDVGLPKVGFVLHPHESVRLPSVLLARAPDASYDHARRRVRAHLKDHVIPRAADGKSLNTTSYSLVFDYLLVDGVISEATELAAVERAALMGCETYWIDASWYGNSSSNWDAEAGNWNVRRSDYPRGLRPISDRAHELGMRFVFWMDPERARPNTEWVRSHPELFLSYPDNKSPDPYTKRGILLNLGDPRAVDLAFTKISALITEFNADIFRQDFNMAPLDAWYAADAPDRVGITEIRHIEGLYALWDRLLAAHPGLTIDNCASGGRRLDLEAMRRTIPFWRSDVAFWTLPNIDTIQQVQCWGLGHWLPDQSGPVRALDAYSVRSSCCTGFMIFMPRSELPTDKHSPGYADAIAAVAENKRLRPLIGEERIGLIAPSLKEEVWTAFQHHRHSDSSGFIMALRGPGNSLDSVTLNPEYIEANATYQVVRWDDYRAAPPTRIAGSALNELVVTIPQKRSSVLIEYQRVAG